MREETLAAEPTTATTSKRMKNRRFALKGIVLGSVIGVSGDRLTLRDEPQHPSVKSIEHSDAH
jgi:hypothetical protein